MRLDFVMLLVVWMLRRSPVSAQCKCIYHDYSYTLRVGCSVPDPDEIHSCFQAHNGAHTLLFQNSNLTSIPDSINTLDNLTHLDLSYNRISRIDFRNGTIVCMNIKLLKLDFNNITRLMKGDLDCLSSMEAIYLGNNSLSYIETESFNKKNARLQYIHLINNHLTSLDISLIWLPSMKDNGRVNASWNFISNVTNDLKFTVLDFNLDISFYAGIIHNNITRVDLNYLFNMLNITHIVELYRLGNSGFDVRFNPFICDCGMYIPGKYLKMFQPMDPNNPVFSICCDKPISLRGKQIVQVPPNDYNCSISERCPGNCECTETIAIGLVSVYCSDQYKMTTLPEVMPYSHDLHIALHSPWLSVLSPKLYLMNVTELDVSESHITKVDPNIVNDLQNISNIFFHENALQDLPIVIQYLSFDNIDTLTLHGNPFRCDCHTLWLKHWILKNKKNIPMQDKILCGSGRGKGSVLVHVADSDFVCDPANPVKKWMIYTVSGVLFAVIVLCFTLTRTRIKLLMIEYVNSSWFRKKLLSHYEFDLFVSHSSRDDEFIHGFLIPKLLQHSPPYKVFIDERHFIVGKSIAYNINRAIGNSHTTLMIVSDNFLQSKWCMMEFREAHLRLLRDRDIDIIVIVLGELNKNLIDDELKLYMQTHVYLTDSDKYFWSKLLQALPILISEPTGDQPVPSERSVSVHEDHSSEQSPLIQ